MYQSYIVPLTVLKGENEEVLEAEDVVGNQGTVVCLANGGHDMAAKLDTKLGELCNGELVILIIRPDWAELGNLYYLQKI